eukprot:5258704-Prymnesium_polylepis.1
MLRGRAHLLLLLAASVADALRTPCWTRRSLLSAGVAACAIGKSAEAKEPKDGLFPDCPVQDLSLIHI